MKIFILISGLLELLVGSIMLINPKIIPSYKKASGALITIARMYGGAAFSIAVFALLVVFDFENESLHIPFLIVFFIFHLAISLSVLISFISKQTREVNIGFIHGLLATITLFYLLG
ncbi:MAG: hypothetical protein O2790_06750 [Bacteroidetes bacterium]|jgi:hypothetical protein|nr:MAG: hypothetical protein ABR90_03710 [Cryomorphaceae bacterium BACL29 MAG-121220-bin8]MDA1019881.1 hypothetical protein [Bacteroidota bacterium]|tara:strand:+ start:23535 stop:23885 length:351 start_codon:yes stop_codon:yes gene_type:complete